jgi:hypothetical protein
VDDAGPVVRRRKTGWLVYAGALTAAVVVGEASRGTWPDLVAVASWTLTVALLVALWAYALQRPLGTEQYWRLVFWIVLVATLLLLAPVVAAGGALAQYSLALTVPIVPAYVAAYRYAYRCPQLWQAVD